MGHNALQETNEYAVNNVKYQVSGLVSSHLVIKSRQKTLLIR